MTSSSPRLGAAVRPDAEPVANVVARVRRGSVTPWLCPTSHRHRRTRKFRRRINAAGNLLPADLPAPPDYAKVNPADAPILTLGVTSAR